MTNPQPIVPRDTPIDLRDSTKWSLSFSGGWSARIDENRAIEPIPIQFINAQLDSPIIAITSISQSDPGINWHGRLTQLQTIGIDRSTRLATRSVYRGTQLIRFSQDILGSYTLSIQPNKYLTNFNIQIYQYID